MIFIALKHFFILFLLCEALGVVELFLFFFTVAINQGELDFTKCSEKSMHLMLKLKYLKLQFVATEIKFLSVLLQTVTILCTAVEWRNIPGISLCFI